MRWSLIVAGEAALVLFLLTWGNTFTGSIPLHRVQLGILAVLGGIGWLAILQRPSRLPTLLVVAPLPVLISLAVTSVASAYPSLSWFAVWQCSAYVGIGWLLAMQAQHPVGRRNLVAAMGIVAVVVIGVYLAEVAFAWAEWLALGFPITSLPLRPLGDGGLLQLPTWVGDVLALCSPVVVVWLWNSRARLGAIALSVVGVSAVVVSGTRSVLLLMVVAAIVAAGLLTRERASRRVAIVGSLISVSIVIVGLGVVFLAGRSFDEGRSSAYASAVERFKSSPISGTGPGTFGVLRMSDNVDALSRLAYPDAHNVALTSAAESGFIGLIGLGLALAGYVVASRQAWRVTREGRPIIAAALLGLAVVLGHAMGEVVFALIGIVLALLACIALAATREPLGISTPRRSRQVDVGLLAGVAILLLSSGFVVRTETTLDAVAETQGSLLSSPASAVVAARHATDASPESVPAWWDRMVASDAVGDGADALESARRLVALEGFGQEWMTLGVLLERSGDRPGAQVAIENAIAHPPLDPVVELNAVIFDDAAGLPDDAKVAARRLLMAQPDIESILANGPEGLTAIISDVRANAATELISAGDEDSAFLVALSGEDRGLSAALLAGLARSDPLSIARWENVVAAWFGDHAARATLDADTTTNPSASGLEWAWRLAVHACDPSGADHWQRANEIGASRHLATPSKIGVAPTFQVRLFPPRYPGVVWRMDYPMRPYVAGVWTFELDRPDCAT